MPEDDGDAAAVVMLAVRPGDAERFGESATRVGVPTALAVREMERPSGGLGVVETGAWPAAETGTRDEVWKVLLADEDTDMVSETNTGLEAEMLGARPEDRCPCVGDRPSRSSSSTDHPESQRSSALLFAAAAAAAADEAAAFAACRAEGDECPPCPEAEEMCPAPCIEDV